MTGLTIIFSLILLIYKIDCNSPFNDVISLHPVYLNSYLNYEKGLIYRSLKQLQDSVGQVNNNLFNRPINKHLYNSLYKNNLVNRRADQKPRLKKNVNLKLIQQMNKEIIKNQLVAYEKFFNKLRRYDNMDPAESKQAMNYIRTLFRFPVLLLFSNLFQLPLLPTLILASPFLNNPDGSSNPLTSSITNSLMNSASNSLSNSLSSSSLAASGNSQMQTAGSQQITSHLPFSLNPLVPIDQLLNNFVSELIGGLTNTPIFNNLMQSVNQALNKPNRITQAIPNQSSNYNQINQNLNVTKKPFNEQQITSNSLAPPSATPNATSDIVREPLSANASTLSMSYQEPPSSSASLPNIPLIGPVEDPENQSSILNKLASTLLETNKNYQLTETLGMNNVAGSINDLAMNAVNTLSTMLKIKKQKKELNSNEELLLEFLMDKNYLEKVTSIGNLLKMGLKQKVEKEMNVCLVRTICESNQKQISFAFDQLFSLAMHLTGMESRIEQSPYHTYYRVGRKMINERNICKLIPKCRDDDDEEESKSEKKLNLLEKIEKFKKMEKLLSRKSSNLPDYQKPFRIMKKARKIRFAKRLFNRSFRKMDRLTKRVARFLF